MSYDADRMPAAIPGSRGPIRERADGDLVVQIVIQKRDKRDFLELLPDIDLPVAIARLTPPAARRELQRATTEGVKGPYGQYARALRLHIDFMGNPEVWAVVGSDTQYLDWCKDQPCANPDCGFEPRWEMGRWIQCDPAHVRRIANGAGEAIKPVYSAVPLCHPCHALQHQKGESSIVGKVGFDRLRIVHVQKWVWYRMRVIFGVESMSEVAPGRMLDWAQECCIDKFLPRCYLERVTGR